VNRIWRPASSVQLAPLQRFAVRRLEVLNFAKFCRTSASCSADSTWAGVKSGLFAICSPW
jgi:hypothetical protein